MSRRPARLSSRVVLVLAVLLVAAVGGAAYGAHALGGSNATAAHPPQLYNQHLLSVVARPLATTDRQADADAARWIAGHPTADEATFAAWAATQIPAPPSGARQQAELRALHAFAPRTPTGDGAAVWAEQHGDKDIWKLYRKQYGQLTSKSESTHAKQVLKAALALGKTIQSQLKDRFARPSPYITDPGLNAINQGKATRKFSYPSKHAVMATAGATVLDHADPIRTTEFDRMLDQILYSRLYARGHYPSDLAAGERLGRLIADYEIHTVR